MGTGSKFTGPLPAPRFRCRRPLGSALAVRRGNGRNGRNGRTAETESSATCRFHPGAMAVPSHSPAIPPLHPAAARTDPSPSLPGLHPQYGPTRERPASGSAQGRRRFLPARCGTRSGGRQSEASSDPHPAYAGEGNAERRSRVGGAVPPAGVRGRRPGSTEVGTA